LTLSASAYREVESVTVTLIREGFFPLARLENEVKLPPQCARL
jgi:hypothetical protein